LTAVNFPMQIISLRGDWDRNGEVCLNEENDRADLNNNELYMSYRISAD